jgi:hypothetical protein
MRTGQSRSIIALVAAYAIALQALFSGFTVVAHATAAASTKVICTHDASPGGAGGSGGQTPVSPGDCPCGPACAMGGHGMPIAFIDRPSAAVTWTASRGEAIVRAAPAGVTVGEPQTSPHLPRAPPTA